MMDDLKGIFKTMAAVLGIGFAALLIVVAFAVGLQWMLEPNPEARAAMRIPEVIGQADGCTVYRFVDSGGTHYFTRCGGEVTTTKNYTEYCGKACTRPKQEQITTEGNR